MKLFQKLKPDQDGSSDWSVARRLAGITWRHRFAFMGVLALKLFMLLMNLGNLGLMGLGIDYIRTQIQTGIKPPLWPFGISPPSSWSPAKVLFMIAGIILAVALVRALAGYVSSVAVSLLVDGRVIVGIRSKVYEKLQRLSFRFFDANISSTLINRLTGDSRDVGFFVNNVLLETIVTAISLVVCISLLFAIHVKLTLASLATIPLMYVLAKMFSRTMQPLHIRNRELMDNLIQNIAESLRGIQIIKGFAREEESLKSFQECNQAVNQQKLKIFHSVSLFVPAVGFVNQLSVAVLLVYGGYLLMTKELPLGTGIVVFAGLLQTFSAQIANGVRIASVSQKSLTGARRVFEVMDTPIDVENVPDPVHMPLAKGMVRFENVSFGYRQNEPVLKDISFDVNPGESIAFLSATGGGKSTLLSLIPRFYDPDRGRIMLDGIDLKHIYLDDLRRNIGLVFQESLLFRNTISANIAFGHPGASREAVQRAAVIAGAHNFIMEMPDGYETLIGEGGRDISGGQRQRLAIARAILLDPSILLLDDPTSAVDLNMESEILQSIENAMAGRTTFIVAHRVSTLRRANRIVVLDEGRIDEIGTHEELVQARGMYQRAVELQTTGT
jgi:ATP-binding cassette subfamily B protein